MPARKGQRLLLHWAALWGHGWAVAPFFVLASPHPSQAIRELQEEVSRLRLRLEDSLQQPPQASPTRPASAFNRPARARDRPADSPATWGSHYGRWVTLKLLPCALVAATEGRCGQPLSLHVDMDTVTYLSHLFTQSFIHSYFFTVIFDA